MDLTGWPALVVAVLVTAAYCLRKFASQGAFFHTQIGGFVLTLSTTLLSAAAHAIMTGGFTSASVMHGIAAALFTTLGLSNPSVSSSDTAPLARKPLGAVVPLPPAIPPSIPPAALFLPFICIFFAGCAWGKCELNALPQTVQQTIACVASVVSDVNNGDPSGAIDTCVSGLGSTQAGCLVTALLTSKKASVPTTGQPSPTLLMNIARLSIWINLHPKTPACCEPVTFIPPKPNS